jgi:hypothetical protein
MVKQRHAFEADKPNKPCHVLARINRLNDLDSHTTALVIHMAQYLEGDIERMARASDRIGLSQIDHHWLCKTRLTHSDTVYMLTVEFKLASVYGYGFVYAGDYWLSQGGVTAGERQDAEQEQGSKCKR